MLHSTLIIRNAKTCTLTGSVASAVFILSRHTAHPARTSVMLREANRVLVRKQVMRADFESLGAVMRVGAGAGMSSGESSSDPNGACPPSAACWLL